MDSKMSEQDHQRLYEAIADLRERIVRLDGRLDTLAASREGVTRRIDMRMDDVARDASKVAEVLDRLPDTDRVTRTVSRVEQAWAVATAVAALSSLGGGAVVYALIRLLGV